jgi:hypothetical protein
LQLKKYIESKAPEVDVVGGEYPAGEVRKMMAGLTNVAQMGFIGFIIAG